MTIPPILTLSRNYIIRKASTITIRSLKDSIIAMGKAGSIRGLMHRGACLGETPMCKCKWWTLVRVCKSRFKLNSINIIPTATSPSHPTWWTISRTYSITTRAWLWTKITSTRRSRWMISRCSHILWRSLIAWMFKITRCLAIPRSKCSSSNFSTLPLNHISLYLMKRFKINTGITPRQQEPEYFKISDRISGKQTLLHSRVIISWFSSLTMTRARILSSKSSTQSNRITPWVPSLSPLPPHSFKTTIRCRTIHLNIRAVKITNLRVYSTSTLTMKSRPSSIRSKKT